jgi:hypothetical protein
MLKPLRAATSGNACQVGSSSRMLVRCLPMWIRALFSRELARGVLNRREGRCSGMATGPQPAGALSKSRISGLMENRFTGLDLYAAKSLIRVLRIV